MDKEHSTPEKPSYRLIGQPPMTGEERAAFLQQARAAEAQYDKELRVAIPLGGNRSALRSQIIHVAESGLELKYHANEPRNLITDVHAKMWALEENLKLLNSDLPSKTPGSTYADDRVWLQEKMTEMHAGLEKSLNRLDKIYQDKLKYDIGTPGQIRERGKILEEITNSRTKLEVFESEWHKSEWYKAEAKADVDVVQKTDVDAMQKADVDAPNTAWQKKWSDPSQPLQFTDALSSVKQAASGTPLIAENPFDNYLADVSWQKSFADRSRAGEAHVARERQEWLANRSVAQTGSVKPNSAMARNAPADVASPLFTQDRTGPTAISWHKQEGVNPYATPIPSEQLARVSREVPLGTHAANNKSASYSTQAGEAKHDTMQLAAEVPKSTQAGELAVQGHGHPSGSMLSVLPILSKSVITHTLAPLGTEAIFQADTALEVMNKADKDFAKGLLTREQLEIININTKVTAAEASAAAIITEPGLGMDKIVQEGDRKLVAELVQAGLPKQQAEQYEMGSMIESANRIAALAVSSIANKGDVKRIMDTDGAVPLSMALNISQAQLKQFGAMSETLGGEALKAEVSRNPAFEDLVHLSAKKIEKLSQMAAANIDPLVMDYGHITMTSNRPTQLSTDSKVAFIESANYIMQSGDVDFRVPGDRPVVLKASVEAFAKAYEFVAQDGGLSKQDQAALKMTMDKLCKGIEANQLPGVIAKYEASRLPAVAANDAEQAVTMQS